MNITILYNTPLNSLSADKKASEDDTEYAAKLAQETLTALGHTVSLLPVTTRTVSKIASIQADCIINYIEYTGFELQYVANVYLELRKLKTPFTGCTFENYATTANK